WTVFAASGTQRVVFAGTAAQTVWFCLPGSSNSRFQDVEFANAAGVSLASNVVANGQLRSPGSVAPVIMGSGRSLSVSGVDVDGLVLDNVSFTSNGGTMTRFDNVTLQNYATGATQMTISHSGSGSPFTFNNVSFLTTPTSGWYMSVTDSAPADGSVLTIDMVCAQPADGSARTATSGGAVVTWASCATPTMTSTPTLASTATATSTSTATATAAETAMPTASPTPTPTPSPCAAYAALVASHAPLLHWRLGEPGGATAVDAAGCQNGTYEGSLFFGQPGAIAGDSDAAIAVADDGQRVSAIQSTCHTSGDDTVTFGAWAKSGLVSGSHVLVGKWGSGAYNYFMGWASGDAGKIECCVQAGGVNICVTSAQSWNDGNWHDFICRYDGSGDGLSIFVDGLSRGQIEAGGNLPGAANTLAVGCQSDGTRCASATASSTIDEVRIFDSALSDAQIYAEYQAGLTACLAPSPTPSPSPTPTPVLLDSPTATPS
ncbi:MAG: hypothetical protein HY699_15820, partial [Deltaproteobacteria bacterium]|nr:hypothetical protein [Deltaproteobacteria bacterium]